MHPRTLALWFALQLMATLVACVALRAWLRLDPQHAPRETRIVTAWRAGEALGRAVFERPVRAGEGPTCPSAADCTRIIERVVDDAPLPALLLSVSIVAGRDGISATLGERTWYLTPTDLLALQASSHGARWGGLELHLGLDDPDAIVALLAARLDTTPRVLLARGVLRRFCVRREDPAAPGWPAEPIRLDRATLEARIESALAYLVRNQLPDGSFRYQLDAVHAEVSSGDSWPRHAGTTLALAQWASRTGVARWKNAAMRAAQLLRRHTGRCGAWRCVGDGDRVDIGSSALALLAYVELEQHTAPGRFSGEIAALSGFLRSLQRPDGEFKHVFMRDTGRAVDVQLRYFSGEAVLALARSARLAGHADDLPAASRGLRRIARRSLLQNRYVFQTEHWLCQALEALWDRAPDRDALRFCLDHQAYNRTLQDDGAAVPTFRGGFPPNAFSPPHVAATASRTEGALATLHTARLAGVSARELAPLEAQVEQAAAFMLRHQLQPGPSYLFADPAQVMGGLPCSPTDLTIRIDYQQHVAGAWLRYLQLFFDDAAASARVNQPQAHVL